MAEEIKTPRTDALVQWMKESKFSNLEGRNVFSGTSVEMVSAEECRQLEHDLILITQERDALRHALERIDQWVAGDIGEVFIIARNALKTEGT